MLKSISITLVAAILVFGIEGCAATASAHPSIDIVASNWKFVPGTITVPMNEPTTLRLTSTEGVHGIQSSDLGIADTTIMPGKFVTVAFTPKKLGTYQVHCAIFCGAGHAAMMLTIKVVP
ncbi:MAG TPA: cupredoxin domain-containing protein [Verrucomicrobiae bacterium]|nr:cupredoxin domain-containing protein [Verrucomicrobiae bacterium]